MRRRSLLLVAVGLPLAARGQDAAVPAATLTFELASVKENRSGEIEGSEGYRPGGYVATNVPLRLLVVRAYGVRQDQLVGGPSWIASERFDVTARAPSGAPPSDVPPMLQTLLRDRFKLRLRRAMRDQAIYALVTERSDGHLGPQLTRSNAACGSDTPLNPCLMSGRFLGSGGSLKGVGQSLAQLAMQLAKAVERSVVDRTKLDGTFDFELSWSNQETAAAPARAADRDVPMLFTAVKEQLGLKLEPSRGSVETLVIESVERPEPD